MLKDSAGGTHGQRADRWYQLQDTYQPHLLQTTGEKPGNEFTIRQVCL